MKRRYDQKRGDAVQQRISAKMGDAVRHAVATAKRQLLVEYGQEVDGHLRVLRLALNEAEALAWSSEFPHLFFPALAVEKAETTMAWHRRQKALRGAESERAFAE